MAECIGLAMMLLGSAGLVVTLGYWVWTRR
jgi:hypothetical protein